VQVEEPVFPLIVVFQPVKRVGDDLHPRLKPATALFVALVEAGVEPEGGMPLRKGADEGGVQPGFAEAVVQVVVVDLVTELPLRSVEAAVDCSAAMADGAVVEPNMPVNSATRVGRQGASEM